MPISALPQAPLPTDSIDVFNSRAFALVAALAGFVTQANALEANVNSKEATATTAANTATTKASEAAGSASAAATSAGQAAGSAGTAGQKATDAAGSASAAATSASQAAVSKTGADSAKTAAEAARDQAYAFGSTLLVATSTTSLTLDTSDKSLTVEAGRAFGPGMRLVLASASDPTGSQMQGTVLTYNKDTGALSLRILSATGSGSKADWKVGISGGDSGNLPVVVLTANSNIQANICYIVAAANIVLTLVGPLRAGDRLALREVIDGTYSLQLSSVKVRGAAPPATWTVRSTRGSLDMTYFDETRGLV